LKAEKSVDKATAVGGDTLNYTVKVTNLEPPKAFNVSVTDTLPNGTTSGWLVGALDQGASHTQTFTFLVPCTAADGAVLTNSASVTGANALGYADVNLFNNTASASTTVQAPLLTLSKMATASVNAGEAITYTITYQNTGTGGAANIVITDTLPASVYYSTALDTGGGPKPTTVTVNGDGTRTLVWNVGALASNSGNQTIEFTARPTLLAVSGTSFTNNVTLSFKNEKGCTYDALNASATTSISAVAATLDPQGLGWWRTHPELATAEILARIQATDQRYDGLVGSPDGALSAAEANTALAPGGNMQYILREQLIALYFNLATRRVNADTPIASKLATQLGLTMVRDAAIYAIETLKLPVVSDNRARYSKATDAVEEINLDKSLP